MYRNLEAEMVLMNMSKKGLAEKLNIGYNTLLLKLKGKNEFTLDEALTIKQILNASKPVEVLFNKSA